ncbi:MAG: hypothetical protein Ct9H300mP21_00580 [Pseudomonadota bacterium]|nr:MAG: hypothetical protein Ct9H300mP21_00580 [Pseudomonadota bacterium]
MELNKISEQTFRFSDRISQNTWAGLLESAYEECLCRELETRNISFERQLPLPLEYKGKPLDCGYRLDLLVSNRL